ncbi:ATP/GTP-binding protein [Streptomyces sp. NPDC014623]|uniref:ATP/GTP-binding protein n=1 Tax=Streptomyces sp. NPDC014623 TaxID=3364875 RepID=UPI0036FD3B8E
MSDESDDTGGGTLVHGPWSGDSTYTLPSIPDFIDTIPPPEDIPAAPPESPEETTVELPAIPAAPNPATALRSEGIIAPEADEEGEYEEGEYVQPRSLADRLGDWLEFRLEMARYNQESEAPFREAEIARKAALLEGRTAQEVAIMEQNGKLHAAMMKAKSDKAAARGKADADRMKSPGSGLGADKGRSKAGGGGGSPRGAGGSGGGSSRNGSGPGSKGPGSRGSNSGGSAGRSGSGTGGGGKGGQKGPGRSSGSRFTGSGRTGTGGGSKGSHSGSGGSGKGSSHKGDGGRAQHNSPASNARAERARSRADRAGARQAGRQERRSAGHSAGLAERSKNRDQARANRQQEWEGRRAKKAEQKAARKAKREAAASADAGRTTLGGALSEEAQRRWDKRRADQAADKANAEKADPEKVSLTKDKDAKGKSTDGTGGKTAEEAPDGASSAGKDTPAAGEPGKDDKIADGASGDAKKRRRFRRRTGGSGRAGREGRTRRTGRTGRAGRTAGTGRRGRSDRSTEGRFGPKPAPTVEWPEHETRPPKPAGKSEDNIVDADIVPDPPAAVTTGVKGLPPAPEKYTERPGTSRPTTTDTEGSSVSSASVSKPPTQGNLAAQHRTDITFDEFLMAMANIALKAASDQERAEALMEALGRVANALREMAADLVGDHNISTAVTDLITDLADSAGRMKAQAQRCAEQCGIAKEAAMLAATQVARVYGQDMAAKEDAGLQHASAAAHHD